MRDLTTVRDRIAGHIEAAATRQEFRDRSDGIVASVGFTAPERMRDRFEQMQELLEDMHLLGTQPHWRAMVTAEWMDRPVEDVEVPRG